MESETKPSRFSIVRRWVFLLELLEPRSLVSWNNNSEASPEKGEEEKKGK